MPALVVCDGVSPIRCLQLSTPDIYPANAHLCEVGPRDGFQFESIPIPTSLKVQSIQELIEAGLKRIQITSFVHPERVPQMADAEEVAAAFVNQQEVVVSGLALNERGVLRAATSGLKVVDLSIATNERHGRDNANMSVDEGVAQAERMIDTALEEGLEVQLGLQTVWGYNEAGDTPLDTILKLAEKFKGRGLESFSLADSTGLGNPVAVRTTVEAVSQVMDAPIVLHLHDTRGMGIANIIAALEAGVTRFDCSLGGLGGCPFIPGATGNVATEDVVYALEQLGVETGIDRQKVAIASRRIADHVGHPLSGKLYRL